MIIDIVFWVSMFILFWLVCGYVTMILSFCHDYLIMSRATKANPGINRFDYSKEDRDTTMTGFYFFAGPVALFFISTWFILDLVKQVYKIEKRVRTIVLCDIDIEFEKQKENK